MIRRSPAFVMLVVVSTQAVAQEEGGRPGPRKLLPRDEEIALARSAAPASISAKARVHVLTDTGYVVADSGSGSSGVACLVNRSWPESLEPECFDAEAAVTIMPMTVKRTELFQRSKSKAEVDREIADGVMKGRFRFPTRLAVVYMMSAGQKLISDEGRPVGRWRPHLMIHYPFLTNQAVGHEGAPGLDAGLVVNSGLPNANLMVVVPNFVTPGGQAPEPRP